MIKILIKNSIFIFLCDCSNILEREQMIEMEDLWFKALFRRFSRQQQSSFVSSPIETSYNYTVRINIKNATTKRHDHSECANFLFTRYNKQHKPIDFERSLAISSDDSICQNQSHYDLRIIIRLSKCSLFKSHALHLHNNPIIKKYFRNQHRTKSRSDFISCKQLSFIRFMKKKFLTSFIKIINEELY